MVELKPCPFCGSDKVKIGRKSALAGFNGLNERVENHTFSVRCNACHARGGAVSGKVLNSKYGDRFKLPEWATTDAALKTRAVCAWNRRADDVRGVGEWIKYAPHNSDMLVCSVCEKYWILDGDQYDFRYCPNCGARMKGAEDETTD